MRAMRAALQHFSAFEASAKTFLPPARLKELEVPAEHWCGFR